MAYVVCWMDSSEAKIFRFNPGKVDKEDIKLTSTEKKEADHSGHHESEHFYHRVAESLKSATEILLVGPGVAKKHFVNHLESHHHQPTAKKIISIENMDHPTDGQIKAHARKFFQAHNLFE